MAIDAPETIPTESSFLLGYTLARRGALTIAEGAEIVGYHYDSVDRLLNKAARKAPIYKPERGVWAVGDEVTELAERVAPLLDKLRRDNLPAPGAYDLYAMPVKAADLRLLLDALDALTRRSYSTVAVGSAG